MAIFKDLVEVNWSMARLFQGTGNDRMTEEAKGKFFQGLRKLLKYRFDAIGKSNREELEALQEFEKMDWCDSAVMKKLDEKMRRILGRD